MPSFSDAKTALDSIIKKSRVHLYKPIQIAEILYRDRIHGDIDLLNLETYRTSSKHWRDVISLPMLGRICTSSSRFQDDLFNDNAMPPILLNELGIENKRTNGAVEAYIYKQFTSRHSQLSDALDYCINSTPHNFDIKTFIDSFWNEPGLRRSLDKIYEIVVFALFSALIEAMNFKIEISIDEAGLPLLHEFEDFAQKVMCLDFDNPTYTQNARIYRVGVTNAADRGLDMYSNWGPAIQIKHLSLDVELAENIISSVSSDRVVIVCKEAERDIIVSLLTQIGWKSHIQSIVTEDNLTDWYNKALTGEFADILADNLLDRLRTEIAQEFPSVSDANTPEILTSRNYPALEVPDWAQ